MALANRCFILSEPLPDEAPYKAGVHYAAASADEMGDAIAHYLAYPEQMRRIADQGHRFFRDEYPLAEYTARLCATMEAA
jgi:glycosyltransferase involved in cell wall biosynthesis